MATMANSAIKRPILGFTKSGSRVLFAFLLGILVGSCGACLGRLSESRSSDTSAFPVGGIAVALYIIGALFVCIAAYRQRETKRWILEVIGLFLCYFAGLGLGGALLIPVY
jgi:hypothetical protein